MVLESYYLSCNTTPQAIALKPSSINKKSYVYDKSSDNNENDDDDLPTTSSPLHKIRVVEEGIGGLPYPICSPNFAQIPTSSTIFTPHLISNS